VKNRTGFTKHHRTSESPTDHFQQSSIKSLLLA